MRVNKWPLIATCCGVKLSAATWSFLWLCLMRAEILKWFDPLVNPLRRPAISQCKQNILSLPSITLHISQGNSIPTKRPTLWPFLWWSCPNIYGFGYYRFILIRRFTLISCVWPLKKAFKASLLGHVWSFSLSSLLVYNRRFALYLKCSICVLFNNFQAAK